MSAAPWTPYLSEQDRRALEALGYGARQGFGARPALLLVDTNHEFCGRAPQPLLEAIRACPTACGEDAWRAVAVMRRLIDACKATRASTGCRPRTRSGCWTCTPGTPTSSRAGRRSDSSPRCRRECSASPE